MQVFGWIMLLQLHVSCIESIKNFSGTISGREGMYGLCVEIPMHWGSNKPAF